MKVLVTGGGGFLGTEICKQLKAAGHETISVSRQRYPHLDELGVESFQHDLSQEPLPDLDTFDAVIHTAAKAGVWGKSEDYERSNFIASQKVLEAARASKVKYLVYTSSPSVIFGKDSIENGDESLPYPTKYLTHYARTKARAEELILAANEADGLKTCAIRPHLIWGEGDPHLIPRLVARAKAGKLKMVGDGANLVDVIHVANAARAHVLALEALAEGKDVGGKAYFVGQERPVNLWEFINEILHAAGLERVENRVGFGLAYWIGFALEIVFKLFGVTSPEPPMTRFLALQLGKSHYFSHARAREDLGYSPVVGIDEGLAKLFSDKHANLKLVKELPEAD